METHKYAQLLFDKGTKTTQWRKIASPTNGGGATEYPQAKRKKGRTDGWTEGRKEGKKEEP